MSRSLLLISCLVIGLLVLACGGPTNKNGGSTNSASTTSTSAASPAATTATTSTASAVGVPECDNFINAYENCVTTKVPAAARPQFQTAVTTWRTEWKKLADNPQTRAGLVTACKTQMETARTQMKAYGCTF